MTEIDKVTRMKVNCVDCPVTGRMLIMCTGIITTSFFQVHPVGDSIGSQCDNYKCLHQ